MFFSSRHQERALVPLAGFLQNSVGRVCCKDQNSIFFQDGGANVVEGITHMLKKFYEVQRVKFSLSFEVLII